MMPAAKHFDPVLGVDIHIIQPPGPVPPVPIPHPFIGFLFDFFDYVPIIGATVLVNGVPRAIAGTMGRTIPGLHFPIGGTFVKPPANECEMFMGSSTVDFDGDAASYMALPALSCQCIGMVAPFRRKKKGKIKSLVLPFSIVLPIPIGMPVVIGGPPTISLMALAMRLGMNALGKGLKKLSKSKAIRKLKSKFKRKKPSTNKACGRPGEPVDVVTGANVDDFLDYEAQGPVPLRWKRYYDSSQSHFDGPMGRGFRHEYQRALRNAADRFEYLSQEGELIELPVPQPGGSVAQDGFLLQELGNGRYRLHETANPTMEFQLDSVGRSGRLLRMFQPGYWIQFEYEETNLLSEIRDSTGRRLRLTYDRSGHIIAVELLRTDFDQWQAIAAYTYSSTGDLLTWHDAVGSLASYQYDAAGRLIKKTDRRGYSFHYEYDSQGRCIHTFGDDGLYDVRFEYLDVDRCTIATWADGARFEYWFDENDTLIRIVDPYGGERDFVTDASGRVIEDRHPSGAVTKLLYDNRGGHTRRIDPLGYTALPADIQPHPPNPLEHRMARSPLEWEFGRFKPVTSMSLSDTREVHNAMGRLLERTDELGRRERFAYDANGNLIGHQDRDGAIWSSDIQSWNLLAASTDPLGQRTSYTYSIREEVTRISDPGGSVSEYVYDHKDRLIEVKRHGVTRERYEYDRGDNLIRKYDADGNILASFLPGPGGLVAERELASGEVQRFEYNERGRCTRAISQTADVTLAWDGDRCVRDSVVEAEFSSGLLARLTVLQRYAASYRRSADELIVDDPSGGEHRFRVGSDGHIRKQLSNGSTETSLHDQSGRCLLKSWTRSSLDQPWVRTYRYSGEGDLLLVEDSRKGVFAYEYDRAHRLMTESIGSRSSRYYSYDDAGNLIGQPGLESVVVGEGNRITSANAERYEYNNRNHIARRTGISGTTNFEYDSRDNLGRVTRPDLNWEAEYDPLGRRTAAHTGLHRREFYWYRDRLAAETLANGIFRVYVYVDEWALAPFLFVDYANREAAPESGRRYFLYTNQIGAPLEVEDDNATVVWSAVVEPYGRTHVDPDSTIELNLRFPGHYYDPETGLHYNRFRYYSPELGRYLESDPAGQSGGVNLYAYPANPLVSVDLRGLHPDQNDAKNAADGSAKPDAETPKAKAPTPAAGRTPDIDPAVQRAAQHAADNIPGLPREQAEVLFREGFTRNTSVVIGGSRVRGNHRPDSDLDVGFGNLRASQVSKVIDRRAAKVPGLKFEQTRIVPGNKPPNIEEEIQSPEEFFMRSGTRQAPDRRAGEPFEPSGYIRYEPDGSIVRGSPDGTVNVEHGPLGEGS